MSQDKVNQLVASLKAEGKTAAEIRKQLFSTKGVRVSQISKAGV